MKLAVSTLSLAIFAFPFEEVSGSTDRSDSWAIGTKTKQWCFWARKVETDIQNRCTLKNLFDDCPVTCGPHPSTAPSVGPSQTPTALLWGNKIDEVNQNMIEMEERLLQKMGENEDRLLQKIGENEEMLRKITLSQEKILQSITEHFTPTDAPSANPTDTPSSIPTVTSSSTPTNESSSIPTVSSVPTRAPLLTPIVSSGGWHACAIDLLNKLFCWGQNNDGQVGAGSNEETITTPTAIEVENDPREIALGDNHSCLLDVLSKIFCWGRNKQGELGSGDNDNRNTPNEVSLECVSVKISVGGSHTCILNIMKEVWCWGGNSFGQLGTGTTAGSNTPIEVALAFVTHISLGNMHTCAINMLSNLYCWGFNALGQLGLGDTTEKLEPTKVIFDNSRVMEVSLGSFHSCVIDTLSQVWCWGSNYSGELGDGTNTPRTTPTLTSLENAASQIDLGNGHSCIIDNHSDLWCWGSNSKGQLGLGENLSKNVPTNLTAVDDVTQVSAGGRFTFLVDSDGNIMGMGHNNEGQLGLGDTIDRIIPILLTIRDMII